MKIQAEICVCDVCGWRWLAEGDKEPERCPSRKCRARSWNGSKPVLESQKISKQKPVVVAPVRVLVPETKMSDAAYRALLRGKVRLKE